MEAVGFMSQGSGELRMFEKVCLRLFGLRVSISERGARG